MIDISFSYQPLFTFQIGHEYYKEKEITDFQIIPSNEFSALAKRLDFIVKQKSNTLIVLANKEKATYLFSLLSKELKFSFLIYTKNIHFLNFTALPIEQDSNTILYFNNKNANYNLPTIALHRTDYVTNYNYSSFSSITSLPSKAYRNDTPIALVEIYISELYYNIYTPHDYFIKFAARKTYWKYAFIPIYQKLESQAKIIAEDDYSIFFTKQNNELLLNKKEALIFISTNPIPLKQYNTLRLKLIQKNKTDRAIEIVPFLPYPSIDLIKTESKENETRVFSEIVVYI